MATLSPELSFVPRAHPHEITSRKAGDRLVSSVNRAVRDLYRRDRNLGIVPRQFHAKLDPFHNEHVDDGDTDENGKPLSPTWSIEVVPHQHLHTDFFTNAKHWKLVKPGLDALWAIMAAHDLVPSIRQRSKGVERHWPGGGCHLHYGADLFSTSSNWYTQMQLFHQNLLVSFANNPWIRWLFTQWFGHTGRVPVGVSLLQAAKSGATLHGGMLLDGVQHLGNLIEPRFMASSKGSYLTFEFRMFSMVDSPNELRLIVRFLDAWVQSVLRKTCVSTIMGDSKPVLVTIDQARWGALTHEKTAWEHTATGLTDLGLDPRQYRRFYRRHYLNRIRHGVCE